MKPENSQLPDAIYAQASEIHRSSTIAGSITDYNEQGEVLTLWANEPDGTVVIEQVERPTGQEPILVAFANISFDAKGEVHSYIGSHTLPVSGLRNALTRYRSRKHIQQEVQKTVCSLVECVFKSLDG